jgi:ribosomal protein S18 acetylase RimI-like enzyme
MATAPDARAALRVRPLRARDRNVALARLRPHARDDLFLLDLVRQVGSGAGAEPEAEVLGAFAGDTLLGVASLRPTVVLESALEPAVLDALTPAIGSLAAGLVRSPARLVGPLWAALARRGRRALVDRTETSLVVEARAVAPVAPPAGTRVRPAEVRDLDPLVDAARASLREEGRPDPFLGDPRGFRRWVAARLGRALVAERGGRVAWVGYADVQMREGWLLQGVYTWPDARRRGLAAAGIAALCQRAFAEGAEHVQLSVVEGNQPALSLYDRLGFTAHVRLRTLLFA